MVAPIEGGPPTAGGRVALPAGWAIRGGEELVAVVVDGVAKVRGTVTVDSLVRVHLINPEGA